MTPNGKTPADAGLEALIEFIRTDRGFDFTGYKRASLQRRFDKRMQTVGVGSYEEYRLYLEQHPDEFIDLFNTILINVTAFFRDAVAWDYLRSDVVPRILHENGRHGIYPAARLETIPAELKEKYFDRTEQRFVVKPDLRRSVIFGRHDVVQDPPISRIDLLCSRNTLMYFTSDAQSRILANFHFALRDGGLLFLGKSEMMLARSQLFTPVNLKQRVFEKVPRPDAYRPIPRQQIEPPDEGLPLALMRDVGFETAPIAQIVVDVRGNVTLANMQARTMFNLAQRDVGKPLKDLELSYKPVELRSQIDKAYAERHSVSLRDVEWVHANGELRVMDVQIAPLIAGDGAYVGVGISFVDVTRYKRLQTAVEQSKRDMETAYEELQSTVEELETTNEELQSTNEELETINDELGQRTDELNQTNLFMASILRSLEAGVIVLDHELRVAAWNEGAFELWGLRGEEVQGKHFMNLDIGFPVEQLRGPLRKVLAGEDSVEPLTVDATSRRGRTITCRAMVTPLSDGDGDARGAIVFMETITA